MVNSRRPFLAWLVSLALLGGALVACESSNDGGGDAGAPAEDGIGDLGGDVTPDAGPADVAPELPACVKQCEGRVCGPDPVCGQLCGFCPQGETCTAAGQCATCQPNCTDRQCGDDGCGGSCGSCAAIFEACQAGQCLAVDLQLTCAGYFGCIDLCGDSPDSDTCAARCRAALAAGEDDQVGAVETCCPAECTGACESDEPSSCCMECAASTCAPAHADCFVGTAGCTDLWNCVSGCGCVDQPDCTPEQRICAAECVAEGSLAEQEVFWDLWRCLAPTCASLDPPAEPFSTECQQQGTVFCATPSQACFDPH